jgi:hypothetical protein
MSSSTLRNFNSTKIPLLANQVFFGKYEFTGAMLSGIVNCYASTNINVTIIQNPGNVDTTLDVIISSTNIPPYTLKTIDFNLALSHTKVIVVNLDSINQLQLDINAIYTNLEYTSSIPTTITGNVSVVNTVDISGNVNVNNVVETIQSVTQVGSKGNLQNATFNPLAQTNIFNCSGYAESTLTYQDTSPANTGDMLIFVRVNGAVADSEVCIGKLIPVVNANATNRYASTTLNLRGFNAIFVQNNSTTETNTNCIISLFSY